MAGKNGDNGPLFHPCGVVLERCFVRLPLVNEGRRLVVIETGCALHLCMKIP